MKRYTSLYDGGMEPWHEGEWVKHSDHEAALAEAVAKERGACIEIISTYRVPVGNSSAGELACEWTMDALKEVRDAIRERGEK